MHKIFGIYLLKFIEKIYKVQIIELLYLGSQIFRVFTLNIRDIYRGTELGRILKFLNGREKDLELWCQMMSATFPEENKEKAPSQKMD